MRTVEIEYLFSAALIRVISYLVSFVIYPFLIFLSTFYPFLFYKLRTKEGINKEEKKFYPKSSPFLFHNVVY